MTKVVYNACYGGFSLSDEAKRAYLNRKGIAFTEKPGKYGGNDFYVNGEFWYERFDGNRTDPDLIAVVEQLGDKANGEFARLVIEDVRENTRYRIQEYDGNEHRMEHGMTKRYGARWRWNYEAARRRVVESGKAPGVVMSVRDRHKPILTVTEGRVLEFRPKADA
jgi:hypothetical protein